MRCLHMRTGADVASKRSLFSTIQLLLSRLLHWCKAATSARPAALADPPANSSSSASAMSLSAARNSGSCKPLSQTLVSAGCRSMVASSFPSISNHKRGWDSQCHILAICGWACSKPFYQSVLLRATCSHRRGVLVHSCHGRLNCRELWGCYGQHSERGVRKKGQDG